MYRPPGSRHHVTKWVAFEKLSSGRTTFFTKVYYVYHWSHLEWPDIMIYSEAEYLMALLRGEDSKPLRIR